MNHDRAAHTLGHLTLALAGACLTVASVTYLPELPLLLIGYLVLVALSWWSGGRWVLSNTAANLLGLVIAGGAVGWVLLRLRAPHEGMSWFDDLAVHALLVPFLGPVLMALQAVRLFQPRAPGDFWVLQGLGLLQVALGCVLANDTLFGPLLMAYLAAGLCALAAREREVQRRWSATVAAAPPHRPGRWWAFGLRWGLAAAALAVPLFLMTPRIDGPEWRPFERFSARPQIEVRARTGLSDEIDLTRVGTLEVDDSPAFTVRVTDQAGRPVATLPADQRWRGTVLDNYEDGTWRSDLTWPGNTSAGRPPDPAPVIPGSLSFTFKVGNRTGGLLLAEPVILGPQFGQVPVRKLTRGPGALFFEAGSTAMPIGYLSREEYRYVQTVPPGVPRGRTPIPRRPSNGYALKLQIVRPAGLDAWAGDLLRRLAAQHGERGLLAALDGSRGEGEALPPRYWAVVGRLFRDHLAASGEYAYTLEQERARPELDPVVDFLRYTRHGACERFAAGLALLLRTQGVPARVIKGYRGAEYQGEGNYLVRQSHAHAWVEALVAARDDGPLAFEWLALDPTPDGAGLDAGQSALARWWLQQQRSGRDLWEELILGYNASQQASLREGLISGRLVLAALPWAAGAAGLFGLVALGRYLATRPRTEVTGAGPLYRRLCEVLAQKAGLTAEAGETPAALARRASERLEGAEATATVAAVPAAVVALYYRARYGGEPATEQELAAATDGVRRLAAALA